MSNQISPDDLMRYLDGELAPEDRARVERELGTSTELQREVAIFRALKSDFQELSFHPDMHRTSVWDHVNAHVNRPIGWVLLISGLVIWMTYGTFMFATSATAVWEKLGVGAVAIGVMLLLASVIWERYREWGTDPYKDVHQ